MLVVHPVDAPGQSAVHLSAYWMPFPFVSRQHLAWHHQAVVPRIPVAAQAVVPRIPVAAAAATAAAVVRQNDPLVLVQSWRRVLWAGLECFRNHHRQRTVLEQRVEILY
jgi:hypothetical protein